MVVYTEIRMVGQRDRKFARSSRDSAKEKESGSVRTKVKRN
jgi:hypothetical protein